MTELSLNVLDIAQNSVKAKATLIEISVDADTQKDSLTIIIKDNGCGMDEETVRPVTDPFYTTRTTRRVGLGVPLYKMAAERIGVPVEEVLFLDDNFNADRAAIQAGMKVCGVYDPSSAEYEEIMKKQADFYIYDFCELLEI